jgi:hypothetical protein
LPYSFHQESCDIEALKGKRVLLNNTAIWKKQPKEIPFAQNNDFSLTHGFPGRHPLPCAADLHVQIGGNACVLY